MSSQWKRECWARMLGDCAGGMSGEHYLSKSLFLGNTITVRGLPWCKSEPVTISLSTAKANILCKHHNEALSDADSEASRFQTIIECINRKPRLNKDGRLRKPPERHIVSGRLLARWLTKTYCNLMTVSKRRLDDDYALYSFGRPTSRPLHVYVHMFKGANWGHPKPGHITVQDFFDAYGNTLWYVRLAVVPWLISTVRLRELGSAIAVGEREIPVSHFMRNPAGFTLSHPMSSGKTLTGGVVEFEW